MKKIAETPLMLQYMEMKKKHPDAILLFRVGDFYETFCEDAIAASEILGITLTRRANGKAQSVELAGFPHHALDSYLPKLVRAGRRVAICEQLEDPKLTKKLVKRGITELVTPGVNTSTGALVAKENNFLAAIHPEKNTVGLALLDISTGEFLCAEASASEIEKLINTFAPKELLRMRGTREFCERNLSFKGSIFELDDWVYTTSAAEERLLKQFSTAGLKGFGVDNIPAAVIAAGSILHYLDLTSHTRLSHITNLARIDNRKYMHLDRFSIRNLELISPLGAEGKSLLDVIDLTLSPMGARLLRRWIILPLLDIERIRRRHDVVEALLGDEHLRELSREATHRTGDLERLIGRTASGKITPRELLQLAEGIRGAMRLKALLKESGNETLLNLSKRIADVADVAVWVEHAIHNEAGNNFGKAPVIAEGVDEELDELRRLRANSRDALLEIQTREIERTGISSLKIHFNNVFGYYLEVRNTHKDKVPADWIRKQTLVNAERYITPELKQLEERILGAEERITAIEERIYRELLDKINSRSKEIHAVADGVAVTDCLLAFAEAAARYGYTRPVMEDSLILNISEGRHPVIERFMPPGESYISNSVSLDSDGCQVMMITGPNMSGKSALLRQTALIALMAQIGSFVPAKGVRMGIVDKIFTRVGASDNISTGESTFMVEMNEAAAILNNMSQRSLVLFDELGRGTSTYDGISIARAIVEHIHDNGKVRPKTLFATHYHELNEMEGIYPRISNFNVSVKEIGGKVVFLRKLEPGGSEHSFGIHVAKLAGMPPSIVRRADEVLHQLEEKSVGATKGKIDNGKQKETYQMSFFQLDDPLLSQIRDRLLDVNVNNLTPLQALNMLNDLQGLLTGK
ncbi:MAG: DNA mismatch repair protein MutS [Muribaculaceae bacterium]|nr:DNA mismatch repair protein MutS [Muribaculaceae bacterium]